MNDRHNRSRAVALGALLATAGGAAGCTDPETFVPYADFGGPGGAIAGTVTYAGPPPCTRAGEIVGAAILMAFEQSLLPPPEGLGTTPAGLSVVTGEELFRSRRADLAFAPDGSLACPPAGAAGLTVSAPFAVAPLAGGTYQLRGFYDWDGDFNPGFSIFNLPSKGDVGGGAIENAPAALAGAPPQYQSIPLGVPQPDGTRVIPEVGALVEGVAVSLGLELPLERPIFHLEKVLDEHFGNEDAAAVVLPADYQLDTFSVTNPAATEASFVRLVAGAGVAPDELVAASGSPFFFPAKNASLFVTRQDVNGDGKRDEQDHIAETAQVPALMPLGLLTKLANGSELDAQTSPVVLLQAITLLDGLMQTALSPPDLAKAAERVTLGLRPAVLCIDPAHPHEEAVLLDTHPTDKQGTVLVPDEAALEAALTAQFGRPVRIGYGCLPQGRYALNLVYETGQAWTVPNEAGVCAGAEPPSADGSLCGSRPRLASQQVVVRIGAPTDASYCNENPPPPACLEQ